MARALPPGPGIDAISPMLAPEASVPPFSDALWLFEIKFDGYRCLAEFGAGRVELRTRTGANWGPFDFSAESDGSCLPAERGLARGLLQGRA